MYDPGTENNTPVTTFSYLSKFEVLDSGNVVRFEGARNSNSNILFIKIFFVQGWDFLIFPPDIGLGG